MSKRCILLAILISAISLSACGETEISVDTSFPSQISQTGSTALYVSEYETSYAEENPKNISQIDGYNTKGVLVEQQLNTKTSELATGMTGIEDIVNGEKYTITSDGVKSKTSSWSYDYDDNGRVSQKQVVAYTKENGTVQSDSDSTEQIYTIYYTYNEDGNRMSETTKTKDIRNHETTVLVTTYSYSDDGICTGYTLFNCGSNITQKTAFINNTNGKPVKEKTYSSDGDLLQVAVNSYNSDGTLSYTETLAKDGTPESRTSYFYDKQGYLIKTATYQGENGELEKNRVYVYMY